MNLINSPALSRLLPEAVFRREVMGVGESTLRRIKINIHAGGDPDQLPPAIVIRNRRYYWPADVEAWMTRRRSHYS